MNKHKNVFIEFLKYFGVLLVYFCFSFLGTFAASFIIAVFELSKVNFNVDDMTLILNNIMNNEYFLLLSLMLSALLGIIVLFFTKQRKALDYNGNFLKGITYICFGMGINVILAFSIPLFVSEQTVNSTNQSAEVLFLGNPLFVILVTSIIVPLFEELIFRGLFMENKFPYLIYSKVKNIPYEETLNNKYCFFVVVLIQSILFGLMHGSLLQGCYTALLGILFAYINKKEDSLLPSVLMHCGLNLFTALNNSYTNDILTISTICLGVIGIIVFLFSSLKKR